MSDTENKISSETDRQARRLLAKELHDKNTQERLRERDALRAHYTQIKDSPAFQDILSMAHKFVDFHIRLAKDGVGTRKIGVNNNGNPILEDYVLSHQERVAELDQVKGIEQLIAYIENKIK